MNDKTTEIQQEIQAEKSPDVVKPKKGLRWGKCILGGGVILSLSSLGFLATGIGQRSVITLADKWLDQLSIGQVEGSLQDGLTLSNTQYVMDGVNVQVGKADLHLDFGCLLKGEACVENIAIKDAQVIVDTTKLPPSKEEQPSEPFTALNLPLGVSVKNVALDNIHVNVDDMDIDLTHFHTGISGKGRLLTLSPTKLSGLDLQLALKLDESDQQAVEYAAKIAKNEISQEEVKTATGVIMKNAMEKTGEKVAERIQTLQKKSQTTSNDAEKIDWETIKAQLQKPLLDKQAPLKLPFDFSIEQLDIENVNLAQKAKDEKGNLVKPIPLFNLTKATLKANADEQALNLAQLSLESDRGNLNGQGQLTLQDNYPLAFHLQVTEPSQVKVKLPVSRIDAEISGALYDKTKLHVETKGAIQAKLEGDVALAVEKKPLNLVLTSESITYPFPPETGTNPLKLEKLNLSLKGDPFDYQLNVSGRATGMNVPASQVELKGKGDVTHFDIQALKLNALEGEAQLNGSVDWADGVEWNSSLSLSGINTKSLAPDWAAVLSGGLNSKGYAGRGKDGADWNVDVSKIDLKGNLLQKPLQLQGNLTSNAKTLLAVDKTTLIYGENRIAMNGVLGDKSDFTAQINAPNLQGLVPKLKAGIKGHVKLSGKVSEPNLALDLDANQVSYEDLKLQHLSAKGNVTTEKVIHGNLELALQKFAYGDIKVENANINASGNETNHTLKLTAKGEPIGADLQISGKFDRLQQVWTGQFANIAIDSTEFGRFQTNQPVNVTYNNKKINANVSAHCWQNPKINLCFTQAFNAGQEGKIPFEIRQFNLAAVQDYLDKNSQVSGIVNAKGEAAWFKNKSPEVTVALDSPSLKFVQKMDGGKSFPIGITPLKINADLANNNLKLKTDLLIENNGRITTDLTMNDVSGKRGLSGNINLDQLSLKLIKPLLNGGEAVDGNINARLTMGGTATSPLLHGALNLTGLKAKSVSMPFDVTGGGLTMNFNGATSTLSGRIQTTESELRLEGDADWRRLDAWRSHIRAQANRFRVNVPNIAKVEFTPDIEVTVTPKELVLGGNIDIPWARIEVEELPESAVSVSSDEVIMDGSVKQKTPLSQRQIPQNTSSGMAIKADIKINIGDDVNLNAYGLKSDLKGTIAVRQGKQGLGLYGQVNLIKGRYASFGQDLIIRKGLISFAGLPSQPSLNIEAIRNPEAMEDSTVTAGVKVIGLADSPEVKIFSEPSLSQNEALSYILTGRSLENSGDAGSSNSMAAALLSMSLSKSSKTVGAVGSAFGLNDLNVTTAGIGDNTKVEVSASLTPKFKVKYGVGIFAPLTELTLRYNLAPKLYLQWVSSVNQAVDLMYRFEFD